MCFIWFVVCILLENWTSVVTLRQGTDENEGTRVLVNVIYRHGDRTPVKPYPNDPYVNISNWPTGWGQLTNNGKEQHYQLGQWLRKRFENFLPEVYSSDDMYVRSTDVDRTLMSAECNLAGLFPPIGSQEWHSHLEWQPIPIHTTPELKDEVLAAKKPCPRYELELAKVMNSQSMHILNKKYEKLYKYLTENSGTIVKDVISLEYLYDTLHIEEMNNKTLPEWTRAVYPDKLEPLAAYSFRLPAFNKEMQRLKSGPLLGEILSNIKKASDGLLAPPRKIFMYSGHDITIANLLMTLKVFDTQTPPYTALILIELWRNKNHKYDVTVAYKNSSNHDPYLLTVPGCDSVCPLERFIALVESAIPENWEEECKVGNIIEDFQLNTLAVLALCTAVFLAFMLFISIIFSVLYWKKHKSSSYYYHQVHTDGQ